MPVLQTKINIKPAVTTRDFGLAMELF